MLVKVCGLKESENIRLVAALPQVDLIGLIFYPRSHRYVDSPEVAETVAGLKSKCVVGVFVDETLEEVLRHCDEYHLDGVQLHGHESPDYLLSLQRHLPSGVSLIKAFSIGSEDDLLALSGYEGLCSYFLFDTPTGGHGGSGRTFDWQLLSHYAGKTPFFLSGGIGPESVAALQSFHHPQWAGIDLNSRFEEAPGRKNIELLTPFLHQIKQVLP